MAIMICPECGYDSVSEHTDKCPKCGYGISAHILREKNAEIYKEKLVLQNRKRLQNEKAIKDIKSAIDSKIETDLKYEFKRIEHTEKPDKPTIPKYFLSIGTWICVLNIFFIGFGILVTEDEEDPTGFIRYFGLIMCILIAVFRFKSCKSKYDEADYEYTSKIKDWEKYLQKQKDEARERIKEKYSKDLEKLEKHSKYIYVCPKCGSSSWNHPAGETLKCGFCDTELIQTYYTSFDDDKDEIGVAESIFDEYVKYNPDYDPDEAARSYAKREARRQRADAEWARFREQSNRTPKCPNCNSTNIAAIGTVERGVSVAVFGLYSGKIGKNMKCNDCGYKW